MYSILFDLVKNKKIEIDIKTNVKENKIKQNKYIN